jgi:NADH-quinone oxidoreductase subunit J
MSFIIFILLLVSFYITVINNTLYATLGLQIIVSIISILLLQYNISNFIPIIYIMLYVGAIFVLFLFLIMLLHDEETRQGILTSKKYIFITFDLIFTIIITLYYFKIITSFKLQNIFFNADEIVAIGYVLLASKNIFIILTILLLFAIITPIVLTKNLNESNNDKK